MRSLHNSFDAGNMPVHQYQLKVFYFQKRKCLLEHKVRNEASSLARLSKICLPLLMLQGRLKAEGKKLGPVNITERSGAIRQKKQHQSVGCGRMRWAFFASFRRVPSTKLGGDSYGEGASDRKGYLLPERDVGTFIIYFGL